jgi:DNA-binding GntR family transcriptional regulator
MSAHETGATKTYLELGSRHNDQVSSLNREFIAHDTEFHEIVIGASGNQRLVETVHRWRNNIASIARWRGFEQAEAVHTEHEEILNALRDHEASAAAEKCANTLSTQAIC